MVNKVNSINYTYNNEKPNTMHHCKAYLFCVHELLGLSIKQIAEECGVSYQIIRCWLKDTEKRNKPIIPCDFCGQQISYNKIDCILKIINVRQNPVVLYFCDKKCKLNWIRQTQEKRLN